MKAFATTPNHNAFRNSIRGKLILVTLGSSLLTMALLAICFIFFFYQIELNHIISDLKNYTQITAHNCINPLQLKQKENSQEILSHLKEIEIIQKAILFDSMGGKIASYSTEGAQSLSINTKFMGDLNVEESAITTKQDIVHHEEFLGTLYMMNDMQGSKSLFWNTLGTMGIIMLSVFALMYYVCSVMGRRIAKPIEALSQTAIEVTQNESYSYRVQNKAKGELGDLIHSFNNMLTVIEKRSEELSQSEETFRALTENSMDLIFILNKWGQFTYASPYFCKCFNATLVNIIGIKFVDYIIEQDKERVSAAINNITHQGYHTLKIQSFQVRKSNGEHSYFQGHLRNMQGIKGIEGIVFNGQDITTEHDLQTQLMRTQKLDAMGQLAGGIAHDFNNVLAGILGCAEYIAHKLENSSPLLNYAESITKVCMKGKELTSQLLTFSRKEEVFFDKLQLHKAVMNVKDILNHTIDKMIRIEIHLEAQNDTIMAEQSKIEQTILNISLNARDAMPNGGTLTFKSSNPYHGIPSELRELPYEHFVLLQIMDTGCGMEPEVLDQIFEPFFTTKSVGEGTGLGLSSVYGT
ncbi:MAG: PAS domain S-box protein, partial [Planctomycetes bacterium]|nr:PAS domain S-box protein [Planctomycetota bacterium]